MLIVAGILLFSVSTVMLCLYGPDVHEVMIRKGLSAGHNYAIATLEESDRVKRNRILSDPYITWSDTVAHLPSNTTSSEES